MEEIRRLMGAAGVVSFFTLLSRISGLLRDMTLAYFFGTREGADAFLVAFRIPNLLRRLTAEGALTAGFVPLFNERLAHSGKSEAFRMSRIIFTFAGLVTALLTFFGIFFAVPLTHLFAPGFYDQKKFELTVLLTRLMFPYIFFISLVALAMGVLNSLRHFMAPAVSPVLLNLSMILSVVLLSGSLDEPTVSLAYGVLIGGVAQLVVQIPYLSRNEFSYAPDFHFADPSLKRLLVLMGPAAFGAAVYQINVWVSTMLATMLPLEGSVSYLYYADRLLEFPVGVFAVALGTAALPSFSALAAKQEFTELRTSLSHALQVVNFVSLPASLGLMVVGVPVFSVFFQRGAFDADATLNTARALTYFALGLWGISGTKVVVAAFYAMKDTRTPLWVSFWAFVLNFLLSLSLMGQIPSIPDSKLWARGISALTHHVAVAPLSYGGLALATSISATFTFICLLSILHRRLGKLSWYDFFSSFARNLASAGLMALPLLLFVRQVDWLAEERNFFLQLCILLLILTAGCCLHLLLTFLWHGPEWRLVREMHEQVIRPKLRKLLF